jgi:hypothetical protein
MASGSTHLFDPVLGNGHRYRDQERARLTEDRAHLHKLPRPDEVHQRHRGRRRGSRHPSITAGCTEYGHTAS